MYQQLSEETSARHHTLDETQIKASQQVYVKKGVWKRDSKFRKKEQDSFTGSVSDDESSVTYEFLDQKRRYTLLIDSHNEYQKG